jgi:hypothetical protein
LGPVSDFEGRAFKPRAQVLILHVVMFVFFTVPLSFSLFPPFCFLLPLPQAAVLLAQGSIGCVFFVQHATAHGHTGVVNVVSQLI